MITENDLNMLKDMKPIDYSHISLSLADGREVFCLGGFIEDTQFLVARSPLVVKKIPIASSQSYKITFDNLCPYTDDNVTIINSEKIVSVNFLSKEYTEVYRKYVEILDEYRGKIHKEPKFLTEDEEGDDETPPSKGYLH